MNIKVFQTNKAGKIEFTHYELEKLLNETYKEGYSDGENQAKKDYWTWTPPSISTTPRLNDIIYCSNDNLASTISTTTSDNITLTSKKANTSNLPNTYEVKASNNASLGDFSALNSVIEEILSKDMDMDSMFLHPSLNGAKKITEKEPFANLKKELSGL